MKFSSGAIVVSFAISTESTTTLAGTASTTRYWDCSGGACGCAYLPPHLNGDHDEPAHCYSNAMFDAPEGNEYGATFYGAAAVSEALGGGYWLAPACGECFQLTGQSNIPGYETTTTIVVKATNFCPPDNPSCANGKFHFDIAAPGFDFAGASLSNTCMEREPDEDFTICGLWMIDSPDPNSGCDCNSFHNSVLRSGCENFKSLYWDNPMVEFQQVDCPAELAQLPCWEANGNTYPRPEEPPALCMDPLANANSSTTRSPTSDILPTSKPGPSGQSTESPSPTLTSPATSSPTKDSLPTTIAPSPGPTEQSTESAAPTKPSPPTHVLVSSAGTKLNNGLHWILFLLL